MTIELVIDFLVGALIIDGRSLALSRWDGVMLSAMVTKP
jgi:hypothetical protein